MFDLSPESRWLPCGHLSEVPEGRGLGVEVAGLRLAVFNVNGQVFVLGGTCPHANAPLGRGWLEEGCVVCPLHRWRFRLETGECLTEPEFPVARYTSRVDERGGIWVEISGLEP